MASVSWFIRSLRPCRPRTSSVLSRRSLVHHILRSNVSTPPLQQRFTIFMNPQAPKFVHRSFSTGAPGSTNSSVSTFLPALVFATHPPLAEELRSHIVACPLLLHPQASLMSNLVMHMRSPEMAQAVLNLDNVMLRNLTFIMHKAIFQAKAEGSPDLPLSATRPLFNTLTDFASDHTTASLSSTNHRRSEKVRHECRLRQNGECLLSKRAENVNTSHILPFGPLISKRQGSAFWLLITLMFGRPISDHLFEILSEDTVTNTLLLSSDLHAMWDAGAFNLKPVHDSKPSTPYIDVAFFPLSADVRWSNYETRVPIAAQEQDAAGLNILPQPRALEPGNVFRIHANSVIALPDAELLTIRALLYEFLRSGNHLKILRASYCPGDVVEGFGGEVARKDKRYDIARIMGQEDEVFDTKKMLEKYVADEELWKRLERETCGDIRDEVIRNRTARLW